MWVSLGELVGGTAWTEQLVWSRQDGRVHTVATACGPVVLRTRVALTPEDVRSIAGHIQKVLARKKENGRDGDDDAGHRGRSA